MITGPNIVRSNLILNLDAANIKSFRGEPTTNLFYGEEISIANLTLNVSLSAITSNRYRITSTTFINPYTFGSFRFYVPLSKLVNGQTYTLSYKYKFLSVVSTFSMIDWNDSSLSNVVNINYNDYKFSSATGTKATYDSTYHFMDFSMSENTIVELWDLQLEQKSYYTHFTLNTRGSTVATGGGWIDITNNNYNGSLTGTTYNSANLGSIVFNGSTDYLDLGTSLPDFSSAYTISFWAFSTANGGIFSRSVGSGWADERLVIHQYPYDWLRLTHSNGSSYASLASNEGFPHNVWINVTITWNGTTATMYFNDTSVGSSTSLPIPNISGVKGWLGKVEGLTPNEFAGNISNFRLYNKSLTISEVTQNYNSMKSRYYTSVGLITSGLVLYLDATESLSYPGTGSVWYDISGNGKHHTINGSPTFSAGPNRFSLSETINFSYSGAITTGTLCTVQVIYRTTDSTELWVRGNSSNSYYLAAAYVGQPYYHSNCGTPTYYIDLSVITDPNASGFKNGVFHFWEAKSVNFSSWTNFEWFGYPSGWGASNGDIVAILVYNRTLTTAESAQNYITMRKKYKG